jgi:hypothetical protein
VTRRTRFLLACAAAACIGAAVPDALAALACAAVIAAAAGLGDRE